LLRYALLTAIIAIEKAVLLMVKNCLCLEFKQLEYDPYDTKAVMDPVDLMFDDLNAGQEILSITFRSGKPKATMRPAVDSIRKTIDTGKYD
jgi:predicted Holliday junction resolvase-like endonuclease